MRKSRRKSGPSTRTGSRKAGRADIQRVHATTDPDVTIVEFEGFGSGVATGESYDQRYISVIRTDAGRIMHYRDYWNPLVVLRALRGSAVVDALVGGASDHG